jgi:dTDP-4-dehydrorhamnose 3,5-epimerase/CDP-3, 6-dideoxy-D-glycero-D-glycero-4-hexulose-5-epimerase
MNRIKKTTIEGLYLIEGFSFSDLRGTLIKPFSMSFFEDDFDEDLNFKEVWFTKSNKDVIRAMHLQVGEFACEKLVSVINGAVLDVVLDIRKNSPTYGKWYEIELNDKNNYALYIPKGCAHGYKVLIDNSVTLYMGTEINIPKDDVGIRWDSFGYNWNIENPILSEKDLNLPNF